MSKVEILRVAVMFNDATNTDKVWGLAMQNGVMFSFWGRRTGGKFKQKISNNSNDSKNLFETWHKKLDKGYIDITNSPRRNQILPATIESDLW